MKRLQGVPEALKPLNNLATSLSALVSPPELEVHKQSNNNDQASSDHASSNTRNVVGLILSAEDSATNDTTNTTSPDEGSRAKSTLPLATDVVCLPCENGGDVGVSCGSREEDTGVADTDVVGETDHGKTDESHDTVGNHPDASNSVCEDVNLVLRLVVVTLEVFG
jgi:hypothetical protein